MAQLLTIEFTYRNLVHSALVTVRDNGTGYNISAQVQGSDLEHIVPDGEINFRMNDGRRRTLAAPAPEHNELEAALRTAVAQRLKRTHGERPT